MTAPNDPPATIENEEAALKQYRFQQQCFLAMYWDTFAAENAKSKTYPNFVQIGGNRPNNFLSPNEVVEKLTAVPNLKEVMRIPPAVLSTLTPQVRLFKVLDGTKPGKEFIFNDHMSSSKITAMTRSAHARGQGVGLKTFEWLKDGKDPSQADNMIQVKMVLHFSSMLDLIEEISPGIRWMDLITPPPSSSSVASAKPNTGTNICGQPSRAQNPVSFKIRAVIGYNEPTPAMWLPFGISGEGYASMSNAVARCQTTLYLTFIKHELTLMDGGAIELSLQYMGALEGILSDARADVLMLGMGQAQRETTAVTGKDSAKETADKAAAAKRQQVSDAKCRRDQADKGSDAREAKDKEIEELGEELDQIIEDRDNERGKRYRQLLEKLENEGRIFKIVVDAADLGRLEGKQKTARESQKSRSRSQETANNIAEQIAGGKNKDKDANLDSTQDAAAKQTADSAKEREADRTKAVDEAKENATEDPAKKEELEISYMYYGDLLNMALTVLKPAKMGGLGADPTQELKTIVGPYAFTDLQSGNQKSVNLADIPISLENFKVWFLESVIDTNRASYPLKAFIRDTISKLVSNALTPTCFGFDHGTQTVPKIGISIFDAPMGGTKEAPFDRVHPECKTAKADCFGNLRIGLDKVKKFPSTVNREGHNMASYLLIFCSSASSRQLKSDENADNAMGRYWMRFGTTGGLVKEIKFKAQDQEGTREMRLERMGNMNASHLHEIYDADITLFGCPVFAPGCMVYIDPSSVGIGPPTEIRQLAQRLGMGGYYLVLEVNSVIERGKFETSLKTKFEAPGNICNTKPATGATPVTVDPDADECSPTKGGTGTQPGATPPPGGSGAPPAPSTGD